MTKLSELIRRTSRPEAPQMGFAPVATKARASMLLVALTHEAHSDSVEGADLVLLQGQDAAAPAGANGQTPSLRGLWLQPGSGDAAAARERGYDWVVFGADDTPASVLLDEDTGLVMHMQEELPDSILQALQWLPLDALLVRWDGGVTVRRQLELQRLSGFARKPLLLVVENEPSAAELEALREAGVIGIVVDLAHPSSEGGAARLRALRGTIDGLRPRPKRSRGESGVISVVPAAVSMPSEPHEPDEDDDDFE